MNTSFSDFGYSPQVGKATVGGIMEKEYYLREPNDKTLKQFFDRFYCIPKDIECTKEERKFLERVNHNPVSENVLNGKNGHIVFRKGKKLSAEQVEQIKNDTGSYRAKARKYKLSLGTISKIMNDQY